MFDNNFDPYQALVNLEANVQKLIAAHNALAREVEQQGEVIDILTKGLDAANKANAQLIEQGLNNMMTTFNSQGQH